MHAAVANLMLEVGARVVVAALYTCLFELVDSLCFIARAIHFIYVVDVCMYEWRGGSVGLSVHHSTAKPFFLPAVILYTLQSKYC